MAPSHRAAKVADRIKVVIAQALENRMKDPRLGFVTITDVRVTGDLQQASIFYTVLGDEQEREATAAALESARGMLRSEVGKELGTRITPSITFFADGLAESAKSFENLLEEVRRHDEEIASLREGAAPSGGVDPYKVPHKKTSASTKADADSGE